MHLEASMQSRRSPSTITSALALITTLHTALAPCVRGPLVDTSSLSQTIIIVDLSSTLHNNMSTANNATSRSTTAPWVDWRLDSKFLDEINDYCNKHNTKFSDIVEKIINGLHKVEDILVQYYLVTLFDPRSLIPCDNSPIRLLLLNRLFMEWV